MKVTKAKQKRDKLIMN